MPLRSHLPSVSEELNRIVERSLSREPAARYANAVDLRVDLLRILNGESLEALVKPSVRWPRFRLAGATLAGAGLLSLCIWFAFDDRPPASSVPKPLVPLKADQLYSATDLESQLTAMKNLIRRKVEPVELIAQFRSRFGSLSVMDFDNSLTNERRVDLQFVLDVTQLLASNPDAGALAKYQENMSEKVRQQRPSGQAQEIVVGLLDAAAAIH